MSRRESSPTLEEELRDLEDQLPQLTLCVASVSKRGAPTSAPTAMATTTPAWLVFQPSNKFTWKGVTEAWTTTVAEINNQQNSITDQHVFDPNNCKEIH
jgi:hypothetical protein